MTSTARRVSSAANSEQAANATLSSVNAVFTLSLILTQASSPRQAVRLLTTAVPSIASCHKVLTWHPNRSGDYYERAPDGISNALARITVPASSRWTGLPPGGRSRLRLPWRKTRSSWSSPAPTPYPARRSFCSRSWRSCAAP